jgi:hypothetical protein
MPDDCSKGSPLTYSCRAPHSVCDDADALSAGALRGVNHVDDLAISQRAAVMNSVLSKRSSNTGRNRCSRSVKRTCWWLIDSLRSASYLITIVSGRGGAPLGAVSAGRASASPVATFAHGPCFIATGTVARSAYRWVTTRPWPWPPRANWHATHSGQWPTWRETRQPATLCRALAASESCAGAWKVGGSAVARESSISSTAPRFPFFALTAFGKNERTDVSQEDRNAFRGLTKLLVETYRRTGCCRTRPLYPSTP